MNLIKTMRLTPIRNEKAEIYKWDERALSLVPTNIQSADYQENIDKVVLKMTNGDQVIIDDSLKDFSVKYAIATDTRVIISAPYNDKMHGFFFGVLVGASATCIGYLLSLLFAR